MSYLEDRLKRKNGELPPLPTSKPKKQLNKISPKRKQQLAGDKGDGKEDEYFEYWMKNAIPKCENCGMEAYWLLESQEDEKKQEAYKLMWRACQAHVLPKKKSMFPSLKNNLSNHLVLFPSWGGHLCGCHGWYDSNWYNASTMDVWPKAIEIFKQLYPFIPENEKRNIPELLLNELK